MWLFLRLVNAMLSTQLEFSYFLATFPRCVPCPEGIDYLRGFTSFFFFKKSHNVASLLMIISSRKALKRNSFSQKKPGKDPRSDFFHNFKNRTREYKDGVKPVFVGRLEASFSGRQD